MPLELVVLGMNCGTSIDAIDLALCRVRQASPSSEQHFRLLKYAEIDVPREARERVLRMIRGEYEKGSGLGSVGGGGALEEFCQVGFLIGQVFADAAVEFGRKEGIDWNDVDIVAAHGQTVWHIPLPAEGQIRSTLQMMESTALSQALHTTVVSDFRTGEVSAGRHGAPLVAFVDALLAGSDTLSRSVQNIGGIANFSYIPRGDTSGVFEFDSGPGNVLMDAAMRYYTNGEMQYDKDGEWSKRGKVNETLVVEVLGMEYFKRELPKTTGRELFGDQMAIDLIKRLEKQGLSKEDVVATITRITSKSILDAYHRYLPRSKLYPDLPDLDEVYYCGGGGYNPSITTFLSQHLPHTQFHQLDELGIPASAKEAISFALLGVECLLGRSIIVPQYVDSRRAVVLGKITPDENWGEVMGKVMGFISEGHGVGGGGTVRKMVLDER